MDFEKSINGNESTNDVKKDRFLYSQDILEKKFGLYQWLSAQNSILMGLNSLLIGGGYQIYQELKVASITWTLILAIISIGLISFSTIICLRTALPTIKSKLWNDSSQNLVDNSVRTVTGIMKFNLDQYVEMLHSLNYDEMLKLNADEILKVNYNIYDYSKQIKLSVKLSTAGLTVLIVLWASNQLFNIFCP